MPTSTLGGGFPFDGDIVDEQDVKCQHLSVKSMAWNDSPGAIENGEDARSMGKWTGKTAVITGSGTGVGRATALLLASEGADIVINYSRSEREAMQVAGEVEAHGGRAVVVKGDVSLDADCRGLIDSACQAFGGVDLLVNNAAVTRFVPHDDLDQVLAEDWERIFRVNVVGPFQCVRAAREALRQRRGQVVNVASTAGLTGQGSSIPYCASKAAVINMTQSLARALAPEIRVNAVAPGFITGRWLEQGLGSAYDGVKRGWEGRAPLGRVCDPEDVARAIVSLAEGSPMVTGQTVTCDGGMMLGPLR
jgi:3-oxoacyl-[acyl-carrier protein] reductase